MSEHTPWSVVKAERRAVDLVVRALLLAYPDAPEAALDGRGALALNAENPDQTSTFVRTGQGDETSLRALTLGEVARALVVTEVVDLSEEYLTYARWRVHEYGQRTDAQHDRSSCACCCITCDLDLESS